MEKVLPGIFEIFLLKGMASFGKIAGFGGVEGCQAPAFAEPTDQSYRGYHQKINGGEQNPVADLAEQPGQLPPGPIDLFAEPGA